MSYLEELLPEFRKGAKIRKKKWGKSDYLYCKDGIVYDRSNQTVYNLCTESLSYDGWEFYKDPEPDWQYIIDNKCLCWFWDECEDLCFTDLTREEQEELLKDKSPEFIVGLTLHLAKIIRKIGDEFDLRGENYDN